MSPLKICHIFESDKPSTIMKQTAVLIILLVLISTGCKKEDKASTPTPAPTPASMTAWETSLVGQWKLKRTETRTNAWLPGLGDSTFTYKNHYNYLYSQLELGTTASGSQYSGIMGTEDTNPADAITWCGGAGNTITIGSSTNFFTVHYLTTDSLVLDFSNGTGRYFYSKLSTPPALNAVESQMIGGTWSLVTFNGSAPANPTFKTFFGNWYTDQGYFCKDSVDDGNPFSETTDDWEVLFPSRAVPIFHSTSTSWAKITNLTATSLTIEVMANPAVNSSTIYTYVYSR
jgi:hypothetical protein